MTVDRARQQAASDTFNFTPHSEAETHTLLVADVDDITTDAGPLIATEASITYYRYDADSAAHLRRMADQIREQS